MGNHLVRMGIFLGVGFGLATGGYAAALNAPRSLPSAEMTDTQPVAARPRVDVYILRGGGSIFSTGLTKLADQLKQNGVEPTTLSHGAWRRAEQEILQKRQKFGRMPIVIIGHSLGANSAIHLAEALQKKGVNVDFIASYAATVTLAVPSNVRNVTNYYFKKGWGESMTKGSGFSGRLDNRDVSTIHGMNHFNVDDDPTLRDEVVGKVLRYAGRSKASKSN